MGRMILAIALAALAAPVAAQPVAAQPVPAPDGQARLLVLGADGVQVYACGPSKLGHAWIFQGPEALLFDTAGRQVGTHGAGPHWQLDGGARIVAEVAATAPAPAAGAIPWLLLRVKGAEGGGALARAAWIRRIDTAGGTAPREGCSEARTGAVARMRYSAVYEFYGN